jgi:hypothetical protein
MDPKIAEFIRPIRGQYTREAMLIGGGICYATIVVISSTLGF